MKTPTTFERLLALDAAACAAESLPKAPLRLRDAISQLQSELEAYFENSEETHPNPEQHLHAQHMAVLTLAECPQTFGGEPNAELSAAIKIARKAVEVVTV